MGERAGEDRKHAASAQRKPGRAPLAVHTGLPRAGVTTGITKVTGAKTKVGYFEIAGQIEGRSSTENGDPARTKVGYNRLVQSYLTGSRAR